MKKILLISGKQGSGKTTLSTRLVAELAPMGYEARVFKFAALLYQMHDRILPVLRENGIQRGPKDGELLQILGTEYGRKCLGENVWADACRFRVLEWLAGCGRGERLAIIDDARFENEFDTFDDAYRIRLNADRELRKARCSAWRENEDHASEVGLDRYVAGGKFDGKWDTSTARPEVTSHSVRVHWFNDERF